MLAASVTCSATLAGLLSGMFAQEVQSPPAPTVSAILPCKDPHDVHDPEHVTHPKYPKESLKAGVEGAVELRAMVDSSGRTRELTVVKGEPVFAKPSVEAVRKWQFHAALVEGKPAQTIYKVRVRFNLLLKEAFTDWDIESPREETDSIGRNDPSKFERNTPDGPVYQAWKEYGIVMPRAIYEPEPEFSEKARRNQEQGTVTVGVIVGSDGIPRSTRVLCSSAPDLTENTVQAVKSWKFEPGTKDGKPVAIEIAVEVQFRLYNYPDAR
jgi:TonB family protein